jgi:hypothetical protein
MQVGEFLSSAKSARLTQKERKNEANDWGNVSFALELPCQDLSVVQARPE